MGGTPVTTPEAPDSPAPPASESNDDADLVARAKADRQEFAVHYARYADPVYRYCLRRLGNTEAAADATSQIFAKAMGALPGCRNNLFRSWLFAIAHNTLVDAFRGNRADQPLEAAAHIHDTTSSPEDQALANEARFEIVRLLALLPPDQRRVVELRLVGLSGKEIGEVLGRSRGSVDTLQFRAMARMRNLLGVASPDGQRRGEGRDGN
jgi:RNA polymerase sigma-70 factor (ECF subfamily)